MKNLFKLSFSFLFALIFFGCNISIEDEILLDKPNCVYSDGKITVVLAEKSSDTQYINLYRQDVTADDEITNIGVLFPTDEATYIFVDKLIYKNHEYKYYARYCEGKEYFKTEWSNSITTDDGYDESSSLKYDVTASHLSLNTNDYTLKIEGTIVVPGITDFATEFTPMIIMQNETKTQVFSINSTSDGSIISLYGTVTSDYIGVPIKIVGICGQKVEYADAEKTKIQSITWTELSKIKLNNYTDNTFTITSGNSSNGFDYSRSFPIILK